MKRFIAAISLLIISLSGCSTTQPKTVTLVAHDSFAMSGALVKQFETQSGYKLNIVRAGDVGAMTSKLVLTKDEPIGDVVYGIDNTFAPVAEKNQILASDKTAIDYADVCFNVDLKYFRAHKLAIPNHWSELTSPKYKNLTVIENPNTSSTGLAFLASTYAYFNKTDGTVSPAVTWWLALKANGLKVDAGWEDAYYTDFSGSAGHGNYPIVLSYSSSPADEVGSDGLSGTKSLSNDCFRQTEYAAVLKNASNPAGALALIKFFQGKKFQAALPESMYVYPIDQSISIPKTWLLFGAPATSVIGQDLNIDANRDKWLADYNRSDLAH